MGNWASRTFRERAAQGMICHISVSNTPSMESNWVLQSVFSTRLCSLAELLCSCTRYPVPRHSGPSALRAPTVRKNVGFLADESKCFFLLSRVTGVQHLDPRVRAFFRSLLHRYRLYIYYIPRTWVTDYVQPPTTQKMVQLLIKTGVMSGF